MAIDLGGIAKGYTADKVAELLRAEGITSGYFSLGGTNKAVESASARVAFSQTTATASSSFSAG